MKTDFINNPMFIRGTHDATLDRCENIPFASVGGIDNRSNMTIPHYIHKEDSEIYLSGYKHACKNMFGEDWETCEFGWSKALTIYGVKLLQFKDK